MKVPVGLGVGVWVGVLVDVGVGEKVEVIVAVTSVPPEQMIPAGQLPDERIRGAPI